MQLVLEGMCKQFGKAVACSKPEGDGKSLVGIYYCGAKGKPVVPCRAGWETRVAAVQIRISKNLIVTLGGSADGHHGRPELG